MTRSRDLGDGPRRPWGAALAKPLPELVTERPRRFTDPALRGAPCPVCGDDGAFYCGCEDADQQITRERERGNAPPSIR